MLPARLVLVAPCRVREAGSRYSRDGILLQMVGCWGSNGGVLSEGMARGDSGGAGTECEGGVRCVNGGWVTKS